MMKYRHAINLVICVVFVSALSLPLFFIATGIQSDNSTTENRKKSEFPAFFTTTNGISLPDISRFIDQFNSYYSDNFAIREILIQFYINIKINLLHTNPFPEKFVLVKDDWIFLGDAYSNAIAETKGIINFSEQELVTITNNIIECEKYFKSKHIMFFLAIAPEKSTVCGQKLRIKQSFKQTKLEQVKIRLSAIGFNLIDLKDDLKANENFPLYYKTDSHWNEIGAFFGYQRLMREIKLSFPMLKILKFNDFTIDSSNCDYIGGMACQLLLKKTERRFVLSPVFKSERIELPKKLKIPSYFDLDPNLYEYRLWNKNEKLKVLIFHDSFFQEIYKFIPESFQETVLIRAWREKYIIEQEQPDIVVFEFIEREIDNLLYPLN